MPVQPPDIAVVSELKLTPENLAGAASNGAETANKERQAPSPLMERQLSGSHSAGRPRSLSMAGLVAIIYYSVAGGPFGTEDVVSAAGPLLGLLGFLVMPLVWSAPEALISAELATTFPSNAGYVTWVTAAFGPFWGFQEGFLSWLCGVTDNAIYPVLFCDYLKHVWPASGHGMTRIVCVLSFSLVLSWLNFRGLNVVGWSAFGLALFTIMPFVFVVPAGMADVKVSNLLIVPKFHEIEWQKFLNVLFWNLNYWDSASTLAGEVQSPRKTFPTALLISMVLVISSYILPLFVGVGMSGKHSALAWRTWHSGTLALVGEETGGALVKAWVVTAAAVSNIGQFVCEQAADAYQLQGMAEWGWLPSCFSRRSRYGTPDISLALGLVIILMLSSSDFLSIVDLLNGLYCQAQMLEFLAFLHLRRSQPNLRRPFRVPLESVFSCVCMLLLPMVFCVIILVLPVVNRDWKQVICLVLAPVSGVLLHAFLALCRRRAWLKFSREPPQTVDELVAMQTPLSTCSLPISSEALLEPLVLPPAALPVDRPVHKLDE